MAEPSVPLIAARELAQRLDQGQRLQLLDIRAAERVAQGRVTLGPTLDFRALAASQLYELPTLERLGLDPRAPVAVICGHGNSSTKATRFLREHGFDAYSVAGGMAAWETVYLPRRISPSPAPAPSIEHLVQIDRVGKGALSYILVSDGDAVVVDPGRHLEPYEAVLDDLGATAAAVIDTHMHADYLSGARAAGLRWRVPYFVHPDDARSPFDDTEGRFTYQPLTEGDTLAFGRATLVAVHVPGHTLGSTALVVERSFVLTGDFLFVRSVGRPDLGGQRDAWATRLWDSMERARHEWPGDLLVLPAHYASESERRADRAVAARFDVIAATNEAMELRDRPAFLSWVTERATVPPDSYRTIKLANLGLVQVSDADAEILEFGPNACAVG
jgi:glyoxylase-like metal-dependent hydrolase (beta-lactamase superfamily II)/rhodanese-related sulfurtransferase